MREEESFDLEQQPSHINYKEYRDKVKKNPNESVIMFISAFFVMLLLFLGIAKQLSPDVDVSIGSDEQQTAENTESYEDYAKSSIDERLKLIQMEDAGVHSDNESIFDDSLEERVELPDFVKKHEQPDESNTTEPNDPLPGAEKQKEAVSQNIVEHPVTKPEPQPEVQPTQQPKEQTPAAPTPVNAKVVVGYYATAEQAQVAKGILMDAGLNINPFVKQIGGAYTIQVGSFSSREKAQTAANELLRNNFPARIIVEQ